MVAVALDFGAVFDRVVFVGTFSVPCVILANRMQAGGQCVAPTMLTGRDMEERPIEVRTDHACVLAALTRQLASSGDGDMPSLAAAAVDAMLRDGGFDRCCLPRYVGLAPERGGREIQIPIATARDVETRVLVWPLGSKDGMHPHVDGWTVFVPVTGELVSVEQPAGEGTTAGMLELRRPQVLRPEDAIRHRLRNQGDEVAVTIHISGTR